MLLATYTDYGSASKQRSIRPRKKSRAHAVITDKSGDLAMLRIFLEGEINHLLCLLKKAWRNGSDCQFWIYQSWENAIWLFWHAYYMFSLYDYWFMLLLVLDDMAFKSGLRSIKFKPCNLPFSSQNKYFAPSKFCNIMPVVFSGIVL